MHSRLLRNVLCSLSAGADVALSFQSDKTITANQDIKLRLSINLVDVADQLSQATTVVTDMRVIRGDPDLSLAPLDTNLWSSLLSLLDKSTPFIDFMDKIAGVSLSDTVVCRSSQYPFRLTLTFIWHGLDSLLYSRLVDTSYCPTLPTHAIPPVDQTPR